MFSNPFTCPVTGPPEHGWAELAALPGTGGRRPLPMVAGSCRGLALSNVLVVVSGPARVPRCLPPRQPLGVVAALSPAAWECSRAAGLVARRDSLCWRGCGRGLARVAGTRVASGSGQAGRVLCSVCIYTHWEQWEPDALLSPPWPLREKPSGPRCTQCPRWRHIPWHLPRGWLGGKEGLAKSLSA